MWVQHQGQCIAMPVHGIRMAGCSMLCYTNGELSRTISTQQCSPCLKRSSSALARPSPPARLVEADSVDHQREVEGEDGYVSHHSKYGKICSRGESQRARR